MPEIKTFVDSLGLENWKCPECDISNPMRREECGICGFGRPSDLPTASEGEKANE